MLLWRSPSLVLSLLCYPPPLLTFALKALPIFTVGVCKSGRHHLFHLLHLLHLRGTTTCCMAAFRFSWCFTQPKESRKFAGCFYLSNSDARMSE